MNPMRYVCLDCLESSHFSHHKFKLSKLVEFNFHLWFVQFLAANCSLNKTKISRNPTSNKKHQLLLRKSEYNGCLGYFKDNTQQLRFEIM